jgi:hypothetical protein
MNLPRRPAGESAAALIVVMVLLAVMCVFLLCAAHSIFFVKRELQLIEKRQLQRYEKPAAAQPRK